MRIRGWLTGLIVFLLAPSLLFASLWFYNKFDKVSAIDRSLDGLHLIEALGPLMQEKALTGKISAPPTTLRQRLIAFGGTARSAELTAHLDTFVREPQVPLALRQARTLSSSISQLAKLSSSSSFEASRLPHLVTDALPAVVIESSIMVSNAKSIVTRLEINVWDKMLIPVQGGQFKIAADGAARETAEYFNLLTGESAEQLRQQAKAYRRANLAYQSEGAKLLSTTIAAKSGADIVAEPVLTAQPDLVSTTFTLWQSALDFLYEDLQTQRAETLFAVALAGLVGGLVILAAFAIAIALSRALADRTQQEFESLGFHDPLTGLPNRRALLNTIRSLPERATEGCAGVILIDLRQFKKVNDRFGDHRGDAILRDVAEQLSEQAEPEDFLCRSGGTEFTLLRPHVKAAARFEEFGHKLLQEIGKERIVDTHKTVIDANAGLFISRPQEPVTDNILIDAALALRSAKQKGPLKTDRFTPDMRTAFEENDEIAKQLQKALKDGEMVAWYQPQVNIHTGKVVGAEALARWIVDGNVRYPGSFLPAAVEAGYMEQIEATVREKALHLAVNLSGKTHHPIHLGLNVSASLLTNPKAVDALNLQVKMLGLEPSDISLEILEAVMIDEITAAPIKENIARLSELGFFIELDDFGTGHSSISSLRDLKVDRVKIDRSFISGVDTNPGLQKFTSALINLAKSLDISVLAEGVETEGERDWLKDNGCDVIQGFLISKAVPEDELAALILKQNYAQPSSGSAPKLAAQALS
ncbi:putative bifunctional diguanylate cyclase/phosphodiesterase [Roseibium sediminicola]|uniref:Bifunctional diguanylate cyclase/phosphodiesterase n=1 Tax=Roseibium sediminicola TaxID=2933272 RepID=A0ABT0GN73_9HYPH|nr:bifunctional diguanylate cyclase/phosphodiesterase [Roseibium sp. CAU 1639]MCK7610869.1 bifunctional diguanylate cyclase/phosphodiesterase [Roseibium sp. CAU 1639]